MTGRTGPAGCCPRACGPGCWRLRGVRGRPAGRFLTSRRSPRWRRQAGGRCPLRDAVARWTTRTGGARAARPGRTAPDRASDRVEEDMRRCLSGDPAVAEADHVGSTQPWATRQAGQPPASTRSEWRGAADRTLALARERQTCTPRWPCTGCGCPGRTADRPAFELWTHDNDIRRAAGCRPRARRLDAAADDRARRATAAVRGGRAGLREPTKVHLVLTGPGGGTWDVVIGDTDQARARPRSVS